MLGLLGFARCATERVQVVLVCPVTLRLVTKLARQDVRVDVVSCLGRVFSTSETCQGGSPLAFGGNPNATLPARLRYTTLAGSGMLHHWKWAIAVFADMPLVLSCPRVNYFDSSSGSFEDLHSPAIRILESHVPGLCPGRAARCSWMR